MDPDDPASDVVLRFERINRGLRATTVARQEAIEQVESTAQKKEINSLRKSLQWTNNHAKVALWQLRQADCQEAQHHSQSYDDKMDADSKSNIFRSSPPPCQINPEAQAYNDSTNVVEASQQHRYELHYGITRASD